MTEKDKKIKELEHIIERYKNVVKDLTYVNIQLNKELKLTDVSQQRELLKFFVKTQASELFKTETGFKYNTDCIEETIKNFN